MGGAGRRAGGDWFHLRTGITGVVPGWLCSGSGSVAAHDHGAWLPDLGGRGHLGLPTKRLLFVGCGSAAGERPVAHQRTRLLKAHNSVNV